MEKHRISMGSLTESLTKCVDHQGWKGYQLNMNKATDHTPEDIGFSIAVLCYRAEEDMVPFVENLHRIMSMFSFS